MLNLRPHHLIDIIRNIGQDRPVVPHPYGHAQHIITRALLSGKIHEIRLVVGADDLCKPCMHLTAGGICRDVLHQLDDTVRKQQYNDDLDHKVLELLGLRKDIVVTPNEFLEIVENNLLVLVPVCTHPKEDVAGKRMGIEKGIEILRRRMGSKGERENLKTDN